MMDWDDSSKNSHNTIQATIKFKPNYTSHHQSNCPNFKVLVESKLLKVFLCNVNSRFFYTLVKNIYSDSEYARDLIKLLVNSIRYFLNSFKSQTRNLADFSSLAVALNHTQLHKYLEFLPTFMKTCHQREVSGWHFKLIGISLVDDLKLDRSGFTIVSEWLNKKIKYDGFSAFFSTIGGAASSLGEELYFQALNAEKISMVQLNLAEDFNDPNAICKAKMFVAISYIQLLKFKEAREILMAEYKLLNDPNDKSITDDRLRVMNIALIKKMKFHKYMYKKLMATRKK